MRVLLIAERLRLGGLETHAITLSKALKDLGHTVFLMSPLVSSEMERLLEELDLGYIFYESPVNTVRWMKNQNIDVLHYHPAIRDIGVDHIVRETGVPLVVTSHGLFASYMSSLVPYIGRLICVSRAVEAYQLKKYPSLKGRIRMIMNPIDTERFHPLRSESNTVVFLGRLARDKYMAPNYVASLIPGILVVGDGTYREKVRGHIVGPVSDVRPYIWQAGVVVGESRVVMEAMACGRPVLLVGRQGYMGPVVARNLEKFEYHNYMAYGRRRSKENLQWLARDLRTLLKSERLRDYMGKWGRQVVLDRYDANLITREIMNVYKEVSFEL